MEVSDINLVEISILTSFSTDDADPDFDKSFARQTQKPKMSTIDTKLDVGSSKFAGDYETPVITEVVQFLLFHAIFVGINRGVL